MPKVNLISTKAHRYGGERLKPGDEFNAPAAHARLLIAMKRARKAPPVADPVAETGLYPSVGVDLGQVETRRFDPSEIVGNSVDAIIPDEIETQPEPQSFEVTSRTPTIIKNTGTTSAKPKRKYVRKAK